jgi:hypothetical protein
MGQIEEDELEQKLSFRNYPDTQAFHHRINGSV